MTKFKLIILGFLILSATVSAQQYAEPAANFASPAAKYETIETITERHQAERKALKEKQNAERLEIRLLHQKEMETLLQRQKQERRSAVYRGY